MERIIGEPVARFDGGNKFRGENTICLKVLSRGGIIRNC